MNTNLLKKWLAIGIILLFLGTCIIPVFAQETEKTQSASRGTWLYVGGSGPGNYTHIQDAIDDASDGDTIFIFNGDYYEYQINITKIISIIGEEKETTVIHGEGMDIGFYCRSDYINITCLSLINFSHSALGISGFQHVKINNVIISSNNFIGIALNYASYTVVENCTIEKNDYGLWANYCNNSLYKNNHFNQNSECGIRNTRGPGTLIIENTFESNNFNIFIDDSGTIGISIYHNFFTNKSFIDLGQNSWDNGYPSGGNYWGKKHVSDDFNGPNQDIPGPDGIYDYHLGMLDRYPLVHPYGSVTNLNTSDIFTSIQTAINDSATQAFQTIYVKNDIYQENIIVSKPLVLLGENKYATIIDGRFKGDVIKIFSPTTSINGFNIQNSSLNQNISNAGLIIYSENTTVYDNVISDNNYGILIYAENTTIKGNIISDNNYGILTKYLDYYNQIINNEIKNNIFGIYLLNSSNIEITSNNLSNHSKYCILLDNSSKNYILKNNFFYESAPVFFVYSQHNNWNGNFWKRARLLPKVIIGIIEINSKKIPWVNFDWHPAKNPYDIIGMS